MDTQTFRRIEKKYLLNKMQYDAIMKIIKSNFNMDEFGESTICNVYFDSDDFLLARRSISKPLYKEKVRLRSYMVPDKNTKVYLEIKKKYNNVVNKRRIKIKLSDMQNYLEGKYEEDSQVFREIDFMFKKYRLSPKVFIAYDRESYFAKDDKNFRITFDKNLRYRDEDINLEYGDAGKFIIGKDYYIMEIKTLNNLPYEFTKYLTKFRIFPTSFSKYGNVYKILMSENNKKIG